MKKLFISLLAAAAAISSANAQDSTSSAPLVLSGSVDTYYRTTLNTDDQGPYANNAASFDNGTGFNIGMVNLIASKEGDKSGFVADLVFGPRGDEATFNGGSVFGNTTSAAINQLYAYYNINDKLTFTMGNFNTFLGYEVISPAANYNYSTSYLFSYGPFSHTGAKLDIGITDELSAMVGTFVTDEKNSLQNNLEFGAQLGYSNDALGIYLNYWGKNGGADGSDSSSYHQIDLTAGFQANDDLYLGLNATYATLKVSPNADDKSVQETGFAGLALYAQYAVSDAFSLGVRGEFTQDRNGYIGLPQESVDFTGGDFNTKGGVTALTLSAQYKVGDLTFIPEIRTDIFGALSTDEVDGNTSAEDAALPRWDNSTNGDQSDLKKGITAISLAAVYAF